MNAYTFDLITSVITAVISFVGSWIICNIKYRQSMKILNEKWQMKEKSELDKEFQHAMELVSYFVSSGRLEKNSSVAAISGLSLKCTSEFSDVLGDLANAIRDGDVTKAKSLQKKVTEQYQKYRTNK